MKRLMIVLTAAILLMLCGCREKPSVLIEPVETEGTNTTVAGDGDAATKPTEKKEIVDKQLVFTDLMQMNSTAMKWSWLEPYYHEKTSDTTAEFTVASNNDPSITATLYVTYDVTANTVSRADVTYNGVTASVLSDNDADLFPVMREMVEAENR